MIGAADGVGDVDGPLGALDGVFAIAGAVGGEAAVDRLGMLPQARGDELAEEPLAVEHLLDLGDPFHRLREIEVGRHDVVIVELHAVEAELLVFLDLGGELHISLRTSGPNGSRPVQMFQGPKVKRYLTGIAGFSLV